MMQDDAQTGPAEDRIEAAVADIDPASVTAVRTGNALAPGLAAFTGVSFFVYLLIKLGAGTVALDMGFVAQIMVSAALMGVGVGLLYRARYFYVVIETAEGPRKLAGLSKTQQQAIAARFPVADQAATR